MAKSPPIPIFFNTRAGAFKNAINADQFKQMAKRIGVNVKIVPTNSPEEMQARVRHAVQRGTKIVGVAGGDGTVSTAVQVLAHTETALAIIPTGTANNFATALRLPLDLPSALLVLKNGVERRVSLGRVGDIYFTEAAGVGLFADALALYGNSHHKNIFRGLYTLVRLFFPLRGYNISITIDGVQYRKRAIMCTVANTFRIGYALPVAPTAKLTTDTLDVVIFGKIPRNQLIKYFRSILAQLHTTLPKVETFKAKHVVIDSRRKINVHVDDKVIGTTPVEINVEPQALRVLIDRL